MKTEAETGMTYLRAKECKDGPQQPETKRKAWNRLLPRALGGSTMQPAPWFYTSSFQDSKRINSCCLEPPSL